MLKRLTSAASKSQHHLQHERFMQAAIDEAKAGKSAGDGPAFGAVMVRNGQIIGRGHSEVEKRRDPTAHAEIALIQSVCKFYNQPVLPDGCRVYSTAEPCPMCLTACIWANVECVYYSVTAEQCSRASNDQATTVDDETDSYQKQKDFMRKINDQEWKEGFMKQILAKDANKLFL